MNIQVLNDSLDVLRENIKDEYCKGTHKNIVKLCIVTRYGSFPSLQKILLFFVDEIYNQKNDHI